MTILIILMLLVFLLLAFFRSSVWGWSIYFAVFVPLIAYESRITDDALKAVCIVLAIFLAVFGVPFLRRLLVSGLILNIFRKIMPQVSQTEQEALDAGTVGWEGELFSGNPHWKQMLALPKAGLSDREQAFLDNEVEQLCAMIDDWDITHIRQDLSPEAWQFIKDKVFFGMIIPQEYGGLEFSAQAQSAVITKIASRSGTAAVTVMVPNSLGPAELLLHYGTQEQKDKYLRKLANGQEIPCFALTGPFAGSDAGAIPDRGIVCYGEFNGHKNVLGVSLTWEKRYITLAPVATLLGLAFKLYDPDKLLGAEAAHGITLALIPTDIPGVKTGRRHFPLNSAFLNGPTTGENVFIPMDYIIGGSMRIGHGWRMLMECLAAGRSISLPASATGGSKMAARTSGAYGRVRKQFHVPVGKFEGVEEALTRIGGNLYVMDAARTLTAQAVDMGGKPSVISAIVKYHCTERGRMIINDAMDVHGGKGICLGPDNYLGRAYEQTPIGITVEGANILTRSLIIFGQGAVRSHPYVLKEIHAAQNPNTKRAVADFDRALFGHISFTMSNAVRSLVYGLTNEHVIQVPTGQPTKHYYQSLTRYSAAFAFAADVSMLVLGGSLKRREKLSARLGDVLSQMYLCSAVLKRFEDDGRPEDDLPLLHWGMQDGLYRIQVAFDGVLQNFPSRFASWVLRAMIFPLGQRRKPPSDHVGHQVASILLKPGAARDRLTAGMYIPKSRARHETSPHLNPLPQAGEEANESLRESFIYDENDAIGALEAALASTLACEPLQAGIEKARKQGKFKAYDELQQIAEARELGIVDAEQALQLERDYALRRKVIMVDDFASEDLQSGN